MYVKAGGVTGICDGVACRNCMGGCGGVVLSLCRVRLSGYRVSCIVVSHMTAWGGLSVGVFGVTGWGVGVCVSEVWLWR